MSSSEGVGSRKEMTGERKQKKEGESAIAFLPSILTRGFWISVRRDDW
jgi:hypothetical protein